MTLRSRCRSVMVVEDDTPLLETLADVLSWHHWSVVGIAKDSIEATRLAERRPDLALVDYQLNDGPCNQLVNAMTAQGIAVLIITGCLPAQLPVEFRHLTLLTKPFDVATLLSVMEGVLAGGGRRNPG